MREISLVEFASGRQKFNPDEWEPYPYSRRTPKHPKGHPGFKNTRTGRVIPELPPGHLVEDGRVIRADDATAVTVHPPPLATRDLLNYQTFIPEHVIASLPTSSFTARKTRLALAALAEHHAAPVTPPFHQYGSSPEMVEYLQNFADRPQSIYGNPFRNALRIKQPDIDNPQGRAYDIISSESANVIGNQMHYLREGLTAWGRAGAEQQREIDHAVRRSNSSLEDRHAESGILRSVFLSHPHPLTIPLSHQIRTLARTAYDRNDRTALRPLSDALEEAGCTDPKILDNLRGDHVALRGNWVIDAILGKR